MYKGKKISVYVPCRNESLNLESIKNRMPEFVDEVLVISNCSTDNTYEKAKELGFKSIIDNRTKNGIGYGFAHMTGIHNSTGDVLISIDGDGQHPIENIEKILDYYLENDLNFVSCNRFPPKKGGYLNIKQWIGAKVLNLEAWLLYGVKFNDILCGMWIFDKSIVSSLKLTEGDWNLSPQIKINAALNPDIRFSEFNIYQYKRYSGSSHQQHFKTGLKHMVWLFTNRVSLLFSKLKYKTSTLENYTNISSE
jgi:glycosyltransferase involved in cell wall biosynthesis